MNQFAGPRHTFQGSRAELPPDFSTDINSSDVDASHPTEPLQAEAINQLPKPCRADILPDCTPQGPPNFPELRRSRCFSRPLSSP